MSRPALLVTFILAVLILAWHDIQTFQIVPKPQTFMHAVWVWFILGIVSEIGLPEIAAAFGVGLIIAMAFTYYKNKTPLLAPKDQATQSVPVPEKS